MHLHKRKQKLEALLVELALAKTRNQSQAAEYLKVEKTVILETVKKTKLRVARREEDILANINSLVRRSIAELQREANRNDGKCRRKTLSVQS